MTVAAFLISLTLVALVFAFAGVFGRFPAEWEWVGIVLAAVGIVMSAPRLLETIWGRPKLIINYSLYSNDLDRHLDVDLTNQPIINKLLKRLGVQRDSIQSLTGNYLVQNESTKEFSIGDPLQSIPMTKPI